MKIKYYPIDNPMTPDPKDCRMQVTGYESITEKELFEYMTRPGSGITPAGAKANYEEFVGAHAYFLKQGCGINTEFLRVRPTLQGVLKDANDRFDSARHKVRFKATLGKRYNRTSDEVKVEKTEAASNAPLPVQLEDVASDTVNETLTPGGTALLTGMRLKFRQDDPLQGIFLKAAGAEIRVERILSQKGSQVVFLIPDSLEAGDYTLEVRILLRGNKTVKAGTLPDQLTV
jgi:hypothetical protein